MRITRTRENIVRSIRFFLAAVLFIVHLHLPLAFAIQRANVPASSDFALEIPDVNGQPSYLDVPAATGNVFARYEFRRIKGWQRPPDQTADPSAFQLKCSREGDAMIIDLSIMFGEIAQFRTLPSKGLRGQLIASYSARLGESVRLQELAHFGIEPIAIRVVASGSRTLDASQIENRTTSLQIVKADKVRDRYMLEVRNISSKNIIGISVRGGGGSWAETGYTLIAPGLVFQTGFVEPGDNRRVLYPTPGKPGAPILVADVVFEDLTFEGEKEFAIATAASRRAQRIQWPRLVNLLQAAIEDLQHDSQRALDNLREQISTLSQEPESSVVDDLARRFIPLTEMQRGNLIRELRGSLKLEKDRILFATKIFEQEEATKGTSRESWLKYLKDAYEKPLASRN